jgi:hypothetical protein
LHNLPEELLADQLEALARDIREGRTEPTAWSTRAAENWLGEPTGERVVEVKFRPARPSRVEIENAPAEGN